MFYSQFILAKKGPLGTIWIAAHLERKLRKNQVADTDIGFSVDSILFPEMPIALRLSSHLLLGVVRIYSRKVNYLFDDCSEALLKVKQAFRSTAVDLPPEESTAPYHSITLPETFDLDDFELPDHEIFQGNYVDRNISSKEQITLQDTMDGVVYSTSKFGLDERFGDGDACGLDLDEELMVEKGATVEEHATGTSYSDVDPQASDQVNALFKYDHNQDTPTIPEAMTPGTAMYQQMEEYDGDNEPVDYAHAPCTPGLLEEPNLSNIQETSGYDDHQEPENHTLKENLHNDSIEQNHSQFQQFEPIEKSPQQVVTTEEISLEKLPPHVATTDQMLTNDVVSVDQVRSIMSPIQEVHEDVDDPVKVVQLLNKNDMVKELEVHSFDDNYVQHQDMSNNYTSHVVNQENTCHETNELELNTEPISEHDFVSPSNQEQAFQQPKECTIPIQSNNDNMQSFDFMGLRPCVTLSNHDAIKDTDSIPQSGFTSIEEHPTPYGVSNLVQGQIQHATEPLERNVPETFFQEVGPTNVVQVAPSMPNRQVDNMSDLVQVAPSIPNRQVDNVIEREVEDYNTQMASFLQGYSNVPESTPAPIVHQGAFSSSISNRQVDSVTEVNNSNSYTSNHYAPEKIMSFSQGYSDVQRVPESTPVMGPPSYDTGNNNKYTGRKRSITESLMTTQSLNFNLNESSTFYTTNSNTTRESFRDDDLLSSILVGRNSSILKMKPTPTSTPMPTHQADMAPSTKRRRQTASKSSVSKRKVLMDDSMVLHGDTIRQQLTNTEDIRRIRKKAPCTHSEISMIQKQFLEDNLFGQPIFTGMSSKLTSLQKQLYDITKITVSLHDNNASLEDVHVPAQKSISHNHEKEKEKEIIQPEMVKESRGVPIEEDVEKENKEEDNFDPVPKQDVSDVHKDNDNNFDVSEEEEEADVNKEKKNQDKFDLPEEETVEACLVRDKHTYENNNIELEDYYENQPQIHTTGDFTDLFGPENDVVMDQATAMEIDDKTFPDSDNGGVPVMPVEAESPPPPHVVPSDTSASLHEAEKSQKTTTSLLTAPPGFDSVPPGFELAGPPGFELAGPPGFQKLELKSSADVDLNVDNNKSIESEVVSEININDDSVREIQEENQEPETDGKILEINEQVVVVNENVDFPVTVDHNADNHISNGIFVEQYEPVAGSLSYDDELENALLDERKRPGQHPMATLNLEDIPATVDFGDDENDIDFLNFDDESGEADDDYAPDGEPTKMLDNTGWSSRTRAVAKYLQIMFDKEGERGRNMLGVNNLLAGKTRKEASRMFFETLVLKTKDYIHVEQTDPFENINVFPRSKLLKSEF